MVARKIKTKKEDRIKAFNYLKKAEDNHTQMLDALRNKSVLPVGCFRCNFFIRNKKIKLKLLPHKEIADKFTSCQPLSRAKRGDPMSSRTKWQ